MRKVIDDKKGLICKKSISSNANSINLNSKKIIRGFF